MPTRAALLAADDARVAAPAQLAVVRAALATGVPDLQVLALRALGRTERESSLPLVVPSLADRSLDVRREAAFAVAQIARAGGDAATRAQRALQTRLDAERDQIVMAALLEHYGRLPFPDAAAIDDAAIRLRGIVGRATSRESGAGGADLVVVGAARGAEALSRRAAQLEVGSEPLASLLGLLYDARATSDAAGTVRPDSAASVRVRRLAATGLLSLRALGSRASADRDGQVRRLGVIADAQDEAATASRAERWFSDEAMVVRHEAVRRFGERFPALARTVLQDAHAAVRLAALDALGRARQCAPCAALVADVPRAQDPWHTYAHALVASAQTDPASARGAVAAAADAEIWQVRMYAARAAGIAGDQVVLARLAADPHVNVQHAALQAWQEARLPGLTAAATAALDSDDGQLLIAASNALADAAREATTAAALRGALARVTAQRRETSRDARLALIARLAALDPNPADALQPYVRDFDQAVAQTAAGLLALHAGANGAAPPTPVVSALPRVVVPSPDAVVALDGQTVTLTLRGGRQVVLRLYASNAPTNVARFVAQVRAGEWDGRTFHRVEPGFVVQGGSPSANEYAGAAAFARDEVSSLSHVRGTVGISTRGRDTGDGQIFVNLVDNPRLDFTYTVMGAVASDLSVVDDLLEGAVIERAIVSGGSEPPRPQ